MALISAKTILTSLSLFHVTLAFFFLTNPATIADQAMVFVLGEAVGMPVTPHLASPSPALSFLAVALFVLGVCDLTTLSMPQEVWLVHHWGAQAPLRCVLFAALAVFTFLTKPWVPNPHGGRLSHPQAPFVGSSYGVGPGAGLDGLRNRVFFTFAFLEMLSWFWVWVTLREEGKELSRRKRRRSSVNGRM